MHHKLDTDTRPTPNSMYGTERPPIEAEQWPALHTPDLPPLPEKLSPTHCCDGFEYGYTSEQLHAYAAPIAAERDRLREEVSGVYREHLKLSNECIALRTLNAQLLEVAKGVLGYIADDEDVKDGPDGEQVPNNAMQLATEIRAAIAAAKAAES